MLNWNLWTPQLCDEEFDICEESDPATSQKYEYGTWTKVAEVDNWSRSVFGSRDLLLSVLFMVMNEVIRWKW